QSTLDCERVLYGTRQLRQYPEMLVTKGRTGFIHNQLYNDNLPPVIQDIFGVCALYCSPKTTNYESMIWQIIDVNISRFLQDPTTPRISPIISLSPSPDLFQIIRLFDGDIQRRVLAEEQDSILARWTKDLREHKV